MSRRGRGSRTPGATTIVAVIMTGGAVMIIVFTIAGLRRWRRGWQFVGTV